MSTSDKIVMYVEGQAIPDPTECFAIRGQTMIDVIHPLTGKTAIYGKTLEDCRQEKGYEHAERMTIEEFCRSKAEQQDTPVAWKEITEERYSYLFECLPPIVYMSYGFLVGEPYDHHALTGRPRYTACRMLSGRFYESSRPMTVKESQSLYGGEQ